MDINNELKDMLSEFSQFEEVEGILLAGSHATNTSDKNSDYDIYIYVTKEIPVEKRKTIADKYCSYMELDNCFWEIEDDGMLKESNTPIEIIYRELASWDEVLNRTLVSCEAATGYTTCFWANLINSLIIYDKGGKLNKLKEKYNIGYPNKLQENIIKKNYPLLKLQMPAYYYQIEKALKRSDYISVNHRIAALIASYFDIIFAINEMPHPGEKKLIKIIKDAGIKVPTNMEVNIDNILKFSSSSNLDLLSEIDLLIINLDTLLKNEGLWKPWMKS